MSATQTDPRDGAMADGVPDAREQRQQRARGKEWDLFAPHGWARGVIGVILALATLVTVFPFYVMVVLSVKPDGAITFPGSLVPWPIDVSAYSAVFRSSSLGRWVINTFVYAVIGVVAVLFSSSLAGYAFAKRYFPGREALFWTFLAMLMVPYQVTLIPTFIMIAKAGGVDTYWGLIAPSLANVQATFLMRQFIKSLPDEMIESARMDGASEWRIYSRIVLPLCKPILATLGVFVFLWHWNDFLWPLIISQSAEHQTLTVGIASLQQLNTPLNQVLAGTVIAFVPVFGMYLVGQRYLSQVALSSGLKG